MIIFGWTTRIKPTSRHGQFFCPHCQVSSTYAECRRKTYVHIFFIPIFPISNEPLGVQCFNCKNTYAEEVVMNDPRHEISSWKCPECNRNWPGTNIRCPICKIRPN
ncbi:MAG TPA: hypothetical protein DD473_27130 [Planctomycetaceae bacterium]|nr:hypothetical protein [Planctomycetaceae bacterium]